MTDVPPTEPNPSSQPTPPNEPGFFDRTFEGGAPAALGCLAFGILLVALLIFGISRCTSSEPEKAVPVESTAAEPDRPDEISIATECDMFVKAALASESSYDPYYRWTFIEKSGGVAELRRKFDAQNAFGTKVTSVYECEYNLPKKQVVYLMIRGPMGRQVLLDMRPSKKRRRHRD